MTLEQAAFLLGLLAWSLIVAIGWRYFLRRFVFKMENGLYRSIVTFLAMLGVGVIGWLCLDWSGWTIKSSPDHIGAWILISPIGLPLWLGTPFLVIQEIIDGYRHEIPERF